MLTGRKRLAGFETTGTYSERYLGEIPDDWNCLSIKQLATQRTAKNSDNQPYPVLSCSKYAGFVDSLSYFKKRVYSDDLSGYRLIERGDFGFPSNHVEEGSIGYQNLYDTGLVSPIYTVFRADSTRVVDAYLFALLKTDRYRQIFSAATNASVDRRGSLRWKEFSSIKVPVPGIKEQQAIVEVLNAADECDRSLTQQLHNLKGEKSALMQQLLTGKVRVNKKGRSND